MRKSEDARTDAAQPDPAAAPAPAAPGYQALVDFERWSAVSASAPGFAERLAAAGSAAAAYRRLDAGERPDGPDERLDAAERRVEAGDWWEALAKAYHWQRLTAQAYGTAVDPEPQEWAGECLDAACQADQALADRLTLVERRLAGEALVLRYALGRL